MSYIDAFGHNGHNPRKRMNVVGSMGECVALRDVGREMLLMTYCNPQIGTLFSRISIMERRPTSANADGFHGFVPPLSRGYFNAQHEWVGIRP